jgi:hypothetical protein
VQADAEEAVERAPESAARLVLDSAAVERVGVRTSTLAAGELRPERRGYGLVLDPETLASALFERAAAEAALAASEREYERTRTLRRKDDNASQRELENARAVFRRDAIALEAARSRLLSGFGEALAGSDDLPRLVPELVARHDALVRIDLPGGQLLEGLPAAARVAPLGSPETVLPARVLGPAPTTDATFRGQGFLLLVEDVSLASGTALEGWLTLPGPARSGVLVPRAALLRHAGGAFVFVETGPHSFERRPVALERPLEDGWFVRGGVTKGEQVVVAGAQQLLSEQLRAGFEEE